MSDSSNEGSSSGVIKKRKYNQTYKKEWETIDAFKGWLKKSEKGFQYAKCSSCDKNINIISGKDALMKHNNSATHQTKLKAISKQPTLEAFATAAPSILEEEVKKGEIRLSAFIAEHNLPLTTMDHLTKVVAAVCHDSKIAQRLATAIVKNVQGYENMQVLCDHLRTNKFSLIVDESTDTSNIKHLCICVRINNSNTICDNFLALIEIKAADANSIYNHIVTFFEKHEIPYKRNLVGFASDGANVMAGQHRSVMTLLQNDIPKLFVMKCICRSFHLCASYACEKPPPYIEKLTRDIYNYFAHSPKRISEYTEFQVFCNTKIHKILRPCRTRWLSVHSVVSRLLEQYGPLQLYFTDVDSTNDIMSVGNILKTLNDPVTILFLQFLEFVLPFFNNLNKEMQSEHPKIHGLYKNILTIIKTLFDCFIKRDYIQGISVADVDFKNPRHYLQIEDMYFGAKVIQTISSTSLTKEQLSFFRLRCLDFNVEGCDQIMKRFPLKNNALEKFQFLDPVVVKSGSIQSITDIALIFPDFLYNSDLQTLDNEWRLLRNTNEINSFSDNVELFWQKVETTTFGDGTRIFICLTKFVFNLLCLPHSSANVERIFSTVNNLKNKQRNKLGTDTINGLILAKQYIGNKSCFDFPIEKN